VGGLIFTSWTPVACSFAGDGGTQGRSLADACRLPQANLQLASMLRDHEAAAHGYNEVLIASYAHLASPVTSPVTSHDRP